MILAICPGKNGDVEDLIIKSKGKAFNIFLAPVPSSGATGQAEHAASGPEVRAYAAEGDRRERNGIVIKPSIADSCIKQ